MPMLNVLRAPALDVLFVSLVLNQKTRLDIPEGNVYCSVFALSIDVFRTEARPDGANYLHALLTGYVDAPAEKKVPDGMYYNKYYSGNLIGMPQPLYDDGVEYADGTKATPEQMAKDVTAFLAWASEPEMEDRKRLGISVILFLLLLTLLSYFAMKQIWAPIKNK